MYHLRIVVPSQLADDVLDLLDDEPSACNLVHLPGAARRPEGDLVLVDLAREEASVVLSDLRDLGVEREGSISVLEVDFHVSDRMERAVREAEGSPADAVVWEEVTSRTSETAELNWTFAAFMVLAGLIAAVGILLDTPILIVGAMVVGPEFGPVAGICVALVQRRPALALRSLLALAVGFPAAIAAVTVACLVFKAIGVEPRELRRGLPQPLEHHREPGLLRLLRRVLRRRRRDPVADVGEVGRAHRRAHLRDDDPGRRQRGRRRRLRRVGVGARVARAARDQPAVAHRRRDAHAHCSSARVYARRKTKHRHETPPRPRHPLVRR